MATSDDIVQALLAFRLPVGDEAAFQEGVAAALAARGVAFTREFALSAGRGRIDFYLPDDRIGLELKVQGSPSDVARQLQRYALAPEIDALVLVTARARLGALPPTIGGKPLAVAALWRALL